MHAYFVYLMTNRSRVVLYTGVTNDLARRVWEHQNGEVKGFTKKYKVDRLVYHETFHDIRDAIAREKQIKVWTDLSRTLFDPMRGPSPSARLRMTEERAQ